MRTHIVKWGNSLAIRIPKTYGKLMHLHDGSPIEMHFKDNTLVLESLSTYSLKDFMEKMTPESLHHSNDDQPIGREEW